MEVRVSDAPDYPRVGVSSLRATVKIPGPFAQQPSWQRYAIGLALGILAILLRGLVDPVLGHSGFYVTVYLAVVYASLVCGLGPSILTAMVGTLGIVYWFVDPRHSFLIGDRKEIHGLIACIVVCPALIALGNANRKKRMQLREAQEKLEQRVEERTAELSQAVVNLEQEMAVRTEAEEHLRRLSVRLMTIQDDERRRLARDLHDTAGQTLAAIKMTLATLQESVSRDAQSDGVIDDLNLLADEALQEIRTTSYLLHPPLLDETGFVSAARWFVEGFNKRSGIQVNCDMPDNVERFPDAVEVALFRVLQESLTNIHRHSGATAATVKFTCDSNRIELHVTDNGHGLSPQQLTKFRESDNGTGVGVAGMRERLRELGGQLEAQSNGMGTTIAATIPREFLPTNHSANVSAA
jgi:signal transduction histidine kinase